MDNDNGPEPTQDDLMDQADDLHARWLEMDHERTKAGLAYEALMDKIKRQNADSGSTQAELDAQFHARRRSNPRFAPFLEKLGIRSMDVDRGDPSSPPPRQNQHASVHEANNPSDADESNESDRETARASAAALQLEQRAASIAVKKKPTNRDLGLIFPLFAHNGELLDGPAEVAAVIRPLLQKRTAESQVIEHSLRCSPFPQSLTPHFLVQRVLHLWKEPPPQSSEGHEAVPEDNGAQSVLLHRRLPSGHQPKEWDAILERFLLTVLAANYTRRWTALYKRKGLKGKGSHSCRAKSKIRDEIAQDMLGHGADKNRVDERSSSLRDQVKCGEDLNRGLARFDTAATLGLMVVIPWEKMIKRSPGSSHVPVQCLEWMMGRMLKDDVKDFILRLAELVDQYIRPGMVLDRLARRPISANDMGVASLPGDVDELKRRLNELLVGSDPGLSPLVTWNLPGDPIDAVRGVADGHLAPMYWDCTLDLPEGATPPYYTVFDAPDSEFVDRIGNAEVEIPAKDVARALMAMTGPGCQFGIVTAKSLKREYGILATWYKQWIVILNAPASEKTPKHMYCAVLFLDNDLMMAKVRVISPLVGDKAYITAHCKKVVSPWLARSSPGFAGSTEYAHCAVGKCVDARRSLYSIAATMVHAMAIMKTGRVYGGTQLGKIVSKQIRGTAKHAFICHQPPRPAYLERLEREARDEDEMELDNDPSAPKPTTPMEDDANPAGPMGASSRSTTASSQSWGVRPARRPAPQP
ncbi:hypothetical protein QBC39DRAFT_435613 [Podospora conica]|nr:hypothetical protein QBC39DRAFT_435613 [Schizothecium conicum]